MHVTVFALSALLILASFPGLPRGEGRPDTLFTHAPNFPTFWYIIPWQSRILLCLNVGKFQRMREQCVPGLPSSRGRPGNEACSYILYINFSQTLADTDRRVNRISLSMQLRVLKGM